MSYEGTLQPEKTKKCVLGLVCVSQKKYIQERTGARTDHTQKTATMIKRLAQFRKFGKHKWAMLRNMVTSLIKYERIKTTFPEAKELCTLADKVVTYTKKNTVHQSYTT
jgi:hypothetical protein